MHVVKDIVKDVVEGRDLNSLLFKYLKEAEKEAQLSQLLSLLSVHHEQYEHIDAFIRHIWEYIEANPAIWQHQYESIEVLKTEVGYEEVVLPYRARMEREEKTVLKHWEVRLCGTSSD